MKKEESEQERDMTRGSEGDPVAAEEADDDGGGIEEVVGQQGELATARAELQELQDRYLRLAAEFENYRKRTRRELLKTREQAHAELAAHLLDVLDDLGRVADIPPDTTTVEALHQGVELVERKFLKALGDAGMEIIEAEGVRFDPNLHEALSAVSTEDPDEDEIVARVIVTGYRLGDRLLRPARVQVKKYDAPEDALTDD